MSKPKKYTHRGDVLRRIAKKHDLSIQKIADRAGYSRNAYYTHVAQAELSYEILQEYGKVLKYNFVDDFPEMKDYIVYDPEMLYMNAATFEEAVEQREFWRNKYYTTLDKYNELLEKVTKSKLLKL